MRLWPQNMLCRSVAAAHGWPSGLSLSRVAAHLQRVSASSSTVVARRSTSFYSRARLGLDDLDRRRDQLAKRYTRAEVDAIRSQGRDTAIIMILYVSLFHCIMQFSSNLHSNLDFNVIAISIS